MNEAWARAIASSAPGGGVLPDLPGGHASEREAWDHVRAAYRQRNERHADCLELQIANRGFFAEIDSLARGMIFGWLHDLQVVIDDGRHFPYTVEEGFTDYFEAICPPSAHLDAKRIVRQFGHPSIGSNRPPRAFRPTELEIGGLRLTGFEAILGFFLRMIVRPNPRCRQAIQEVLGQLDLGPRHRAVHLRRGDKIGDEDVYYPFGLSWQCLSGVPEGTTLFVMSDDARAVDDVRAWVDRQGHRVRIATLVEPGDAGFDIRRMQRGELYDDTWRATVRLLAETMVAATAERAVSLGGSYVGTTIRRLSHNPQAVHLLSMSDLRRYRSAPLPTGRHILDSYRKVLLLRIGHFGAGFFAYVQYALNQIRYAERHGYLPVVHYNGAWDNYFHDPAVGDDMWAYYFEPVAGYAKTDIDRMVADPDDPLSKEHVIMLSGREINELCQFDPRSIFHYTYGYWRDHPPEDPNAWYAEMRQRGHRYVAEYVHVRATIQQEVDDFFARHMRGHWLLGLHIRGTDLRYAPPVPLERFMAEIDRFIARHPELRIFLATDQEQYVDRLVERYGDRVRYQACLRSTSAENAMTFAARRPAEQGKEVLIDALLLARCNRLLKCPSAVSEFALYFNPRIKAIDLNRHATQVAGVDYARPGLEYGQNPAAWELVGAGIGSHAVAGATPPSPERPAWIKPELQWVGK